MDDFYYIMKACTKDDSVLSPWSCRILSGEELLRVTLQNKADISQYVALSLRTGGVCLLEVHLQNRYSTSISYGKGTLLRRKDLEHMNRMLRKSIRNMVFALDRYWGMESESIEKKALELVIQGRYPSLMADLQSLADASRLSR